LGRALITDERSRIGLMLDLGWGLPAIIDNLKQNGKVSGACEPTEDDRSSVNFTLQSTHFTEIRKSISPLEKHFSEYIRS
jgi:hypothetical protein